jgi:hypothetical protein
VVRSEGGSSTADYGDDVSAPDSANARRRAVTTGRARTTRKVRNPTPTSHSHLYPAHELLGTRAHTRAAGTRHERRVVANRHACTVGATQVQGSGGGPHSPSAVHHGNHEAPYIGKRRNRRVARRVRASVRAGARLAGGLCPLIFRMRTFKIVKLKNFEYNLEISKNGSYRATIGLQLSQRASYVLINRFVGKRVEDAGILGPELLFTTRSTRFLANLHSNFE